MAKGREQPTTATVWLFMGRARVRLQVDSASFRVSDAPDSAAARWFLPLKVGAVPGR
jgi:hypothetical protein